MIRFEDIPRILEEFVCEAVPGDWPHGDLSRVEQDSRRIATRGLFVAIRGVQEDGREHIPDAAARGASAVIGPPPRSGPLPYLSVRDPRRSAALLSARHNGDPSHVLEVVGITGTNGKTTTSWLLQSIWEGCGIPAAVSGTLGVGRPGALRAASRTTPEAPRFQGALRELLEEGYRAVAAEISSHALDQDRTYATRFRAVVFTNLTRDHLDYHIDLAAYRDAKKKLFDGALRGDPTQSLAVMNLDDPASEEILRGSADRLFGYGTNPSAFVRLKTLEARAGGLLLRVATPAGERAVRSPLIGAYNAWNLLAAYATALALGLPIEKVEEAIARGVQVPGRMERITRGQPFLVLVDYAHTPDALGRALDALRPLTEGRLAVVFGCGGDRDQGKRCEMGRTAATRADRVLLTSDNPRSEDPMAILRAIDEGVRAGGGAAEIVTADREEAIFAALTSAVAGDTVLIAGKGHEDYQETAAGKRPFDDREVARRALSSLGWGR